MSGSTVVMIYGSLNNNLRIIVDGRTRPLNDCEREVALPLPYVYDSPLTYTRLRTELAGKGLLPKSFRFAGLPDPVTRPKAAVTPRDPESTILAKMPGWHELRLVFKRAGLTADWQRVSGDALAGDPEMLDSISWVLSVYKDDDEVRRELDRLSLPNGRSVIDALLNVRFDRFHALSLKALRAIVPNMERGMRYDEACVAAGYHHSIPESKQSGKHLYLPSLYSGRDKQGTMIVDRDLDVPRNPVVLRSLNQARKVLNALIRAHGSPHAVHIELARDLSRPYDERRRIEKEQVEFRGRNESDRQSFAQHFGMTGAPRGGDFEKWRLYREQQGKCAYSIQALDLSRILEPGYVEVDHVLPYSRSFDDSKNNKVLVLSAYFGDRDRSFRLIVTGGFGSS